MNRNEKVISFNFDLLSKRRLLFLIIIIQCLSYSFTLRAQEKFAVNNTISLTDSLDPEAAFETLKKFEPNYESYADSINRRLIKRKVSLLLELDSVAQALLLMQKYQNLCLESADQIAQLWLHNLQAETYLNLNHIDSAKRHNYQAQILAKKLNNKEQEGMLALREGAILYAQGDYIASIKAVFNASRLFSSINQLRKAAFAYLQVGTTYLYIDYYDKATNYYQMAAKSFLELGDSLGYHICQANLGLVALEKENYRKALEYFNKAHPKIVASERPLSIGNSYRYLGISYQGLNQLDSANSKLRKALSIDLKINYAIGITSDYISLAELAVESKEIKQAKVYIDSAHFYYPIGSDIELEADLYRMLASIYHRKKKYDSSSYYFTHYLALQDSLGKEQTLINAIAESESQELERARKELLVAQESERIMAEENRKQQYLLIVISIVLVISVFLVALIASINRKNKQLNLALSNKNKLIEYDLSVKESLINEIHHRVKNNLQVTSSILSIQASLSKDQKLKEALWETKNRMQNLIAVNESLDRGKAGEVKYFSHFLKKLTDEYVNNFKLKGEVDTHIELDDFILSAEEIIPAGILFGEIISNVFKHAIRGSKKQELRILLKKKQEKITLIISDNGPGFPANVNPSDNESLGLLLINSMIEQLEAKVKLIQEKGVEYQIEWNCFQKSEVN